MADFSIVGPTPIMQKPSFYGRFQLEKGFVQHGDSLIRRNVLSDLTTWFQLFATPKIYTYYNLE